VKSAFAAAQSAGATGMWLNRLFTHAFKTAKRVRTETGVAENAVSVSFAAVELAKKVFGRLDGKSVLVIGAGKMGGLSVRHLKQAGVERVHIANRSAERGRELAEQLGGSAHGLDELPDLLGRVDLLLERSAPVLLVRRWLESVDAVLGKPEAATSLLRHPVFALRRDGSGGSHIAVSFPPNLEAFSAEFHGLDATGLLRTVIASSMRATKALQRRHQLHTLAEHARRAKALAVEADVALHRFARSEARVASDPSAVTLVAGASARVLALIEAGVRGAVSLPDGARSASQSLDLILRADAPADTVWEGVGPAGWLDDGVGDFVHSMSDAVGAHAAAVDAALDAQRRVQRILDHLASDASSGTALSRTAVVAAVRELLGVLRKLQGDRKSTRLNSSHNVDAF
jgi:hypothetical protein